MTKPKRKTDVLERLIRYHVAVSEFVETVAIALPIQPLERTPKKLRLLNEFFQQSIVDHFRFEEEMIFPPLTSKSSPPEWAALVSTLRREHEVILNKVEEFRQTFAQDAPQREQTEDKAYDLAREITELTLDHAAKEDDELLPILRRDIHLFSADQAN